MVYTNLTSEFHIKSLLNCPIGSYIDSDSITDDLNIVANVISFKETGLNKSIKNERVFGDTIATTVTNATQMEVSLSILLDEDTLSNGQTIQTVLSNMNDLNTVDDYQVYSETDTQRRHRIAIQWTDDTNTYMKIYYNAYVQNVVLENDKTPQLNISLNIPILDVETGKGNYYEYEGTDSAATLATIDSVMKWV